MCCKAETVLSIILGVIDICGLASDWLFFAELQVTEKGLVYGPEDEKVLNALLAFCVIGTAIFIFEGVSHIYSLCSDSGKECINTDLISFLAVLFGDIPQVSISVYVAYCREDGVSYFQLAKAVFVFLGIIIRLIISIYIYYKGRKHKCLKVLMIIGLVVNLGLAIAVFVLANVRATDVTINRSPSEVFEDQYDDEKYFRNVGVFLQHPENSSQNSWVGVMSIYDIYKRPEISLLYTYRYEQSATHWNFAIWTKKLQEGLTTTEGPPECYRMQLTTGNISTVNMSDCWNSLFSQPTSLHIKFTYTPPEYIIRKKIFGDIVYNMKVSKNNSCIAQDMFAASINGLPLPTFGYFYVNASLANFTGPHLLLDNGQPHLYRPQTDLQDISEVWRTGYGRCESSGTRAPTFNSNMEVDCSN
ncbi:uncharacterized protein LOC112561588 isoform X1 [Pomacea canaliculata]|uniref:uncharacterized protein LOC112561588 isoform X1 n=1 Tax=Pomacea canaliculata TaxID=400727 RepID=UPI000D73EB00|nr:uncharacterized protein LOC112561588 isoform X1 [Pomacea canaliculata]